MCVAVASRAAVGALVTAADCAGNAASLTHVQGRRAANAVEDARISVARFFRAQPNEIYFTSGATESNNIALNSFAASRLRRKPTSSYPLATRRSTARESGS